MKVLMVEPGKVPYAAEIGEGLEPLQPCHCVVMAGTAVGVKNFLFLHIQFHNDLPPFRCCGAMRLSLIHISARLRRETDGEDDEQRPRQGVAMGILKYLREARR